MKKLFMISAILPVFCTAHEFSSPHLKLKIRLQPRFDFGNLYKEDGKLKDVSDFYFRRVRLEVSRK